MVLLAAGIAHPSGTGAGEGLGWAPSAARAGRVYLLRIAKADAVPALERDRTLTSPICSSTSSSGSTVRPLLLLETGQPKLTGTLGEDADETSEEGEEGGSGGGEET